MTEKNFCDVRIIENREISDGIFSMYLNAPQIAKNAKAGQFVMVYLDKGELLLPRPISICDAGLNDGEIHIVYQVVGEGTSVMSQKKSGENIKILAPLGNGFTIQKPETERRRVALVGGGIGTPPLYFLAKQLKAYGIVTDIFLGFRSKPILTEMFQVVANNLYIATEDGSEGFHGYVTELLFNENAEKYNEIFACGPLPLLRSLSEFSQNKKIPCQLCMEERMACGLGTCVGCVVRVGESYARVCTDGPVFFADKLKDGVL